MIYLFNGKYYVNISPRIYVEIIPKLKGDDLTFSNGESKIELNNPPLTITINQIKEKLKEKPKEEKKETNKRITRW